MNAKEAAALAAINKKQTEEHKKERQDKRKTEDTALLYKHFHDKIETSVNAGHSSIGAAEQNIEFPADRFPDGVIQEVVNKLRVEGYYVVMTKHNAYNKVKFEVSWLVGDKK